MASISAARILRITATTTVPTTAARGGERSGANRRARVWADSELGKAMNSAPPAVSVIIPCRNEREHIEACVCSILIQEPPPGDFEIIIADGMSEDGTREILARLTELVGC
jgi:cellulose synthase/poly-beta-1,6-N-acetylglucosamine synthase-like glycosyltransferase